MKYKQKIKHHFKEIAETKTSAHSIALGFAIGTFISILPTPFINVLIAMLVVLLFEKVNKFALFASVIWWNPVNLAPFYWLSIETGNLIFGPLPIMEIKLSLFDKIVYVTRRILVGSIIIGAVTSALSYYITKKAVEIYRTRLSK